MKRSEDILSSGEEADAGVSADRTVEAKHLQGCRMQALIRTLSLCSQLLFKLSCVDSNEHEWVTDAFC